MDESIDKVDGESSGDSKIDPSSRKSKPKLSNPKSAPSDVFEDIVKANNSLDSLRRQAGITSRIEQIMKGIPADTIGRYQSVFTDQLKGITAQFAHSSLFDQVAKNNSFDISNLYRQGLLSEQLASRIKALDDFSEAFKYTSILGKVSKESLPTMTGIRDFDQLTSPFRTTNALMAGLNYSTSLEQFIRTRTLEIGARYLLGELFEQNFAGLDADIFATSLDHRKLHTQQVLLDLTGRLDRDTAFRFADEIQLALPEQVSEPSEEEIAGAERERILIAANQFDPLIAELIQNPDLRFGLDPRRFEELVAEIFDRMGYEVKLTNQTRDGGVDVIAKMDAGMGKFIVAVECKRYAEKSKVGPELVRSLHGVVTDGRFNKGILVTTSTFMPESHRFAKRNNEILTLEDGEDFIAKLRSIRDDVRQPRNEKSSDLV